MMSVGDSIGYISRDENHVTVADITRLYAFDKTDFAAMRRVIEVKALSESWRGYFRQRLDNVANSGRMI
jgi:MOSC domain-containing protein YiiM